MKTIALTLIATFAFAGTVLAAPELHNVACTNSALTTHGTWDCP